MSDLTALVIIYVAMGLFVSSSIVITDDASKDAPNTMYVWVQIMTRFVFHTMFWPISIGLIGSR